MTLTFTEGVDIARAEDRMTIMEGANQAIVDGYPGDNSDAPITYTSQDANPFLIGSDGYQRFVPYRIASPMIEAQGSTSSSLSCQEISQATLEQSNRYQEQLTFTTPRDDVVNPGDTITVVAPTRLDITSRNFVVSRVSVSVDRNGRWQQELTAMTEVPITESRNGAVYPSQAASASAVGYAPTLVYAIVAALASMTAVGKAPTVTGGASVAPPKGEMSGAGLAPDVTGGATVGAALSSVAAVGYAPEVAGS